MILLAGLLAGCTTSGLEQRAGYVADSRHHAWGARPRVKVVVIHYTAEDYSSSLATLTAKNVSTHYLIAPQPGQFNPVILQLVPEAQLAWHAGPSFWRGATRINDTSIGIELVNAGYRRTAHGIVWSPFPPQQIAALQALVKDITQRYGIAPYNIVGHSDIAPQRKQDPGPLFPWRELAKAGIGAWPDSQRVQQLMRAQPAHQSVAVEAVLAALQRYGYPVDAQMTPAQQRKVIAAFQMHYRPADYRGWPDVETLAIAQALLEKYGDA